MKPFNLEAAKAGAPVVTRDGRPARIVCFDRKGTDWPIIALTDNGDNEALHGYTLDGNLYFVGPCHGDLLMAPVKKDGWVNLYRSKDGGVYSGRGVFSSETDAKDAASVCSTPVLATVRVEWEE